MLFFANTTFAQTQYNIFRSLIPETTNKYYLGSTTPDRVWAGLYVNQICLSGDCKTIWPTGGGGSGGGSWSTTTSQTSGILINYPNNTTDVVVIGSTASTSAEVYFDPNNNRFQIGNINTASTTILGNFFLPTLSQGYSYLGSNGRINTVSTSTLAGQVFPFTSVTNYNSTSTVLGLLNGLFSTASSTFSGNLFLPALSQGLVYRGSNGLLSSTATTTLSTSGSGISLSGTPVILGSTPLTISNTGVTSVIAGSGISVSGATGDVTISATGGGGTGNVATSTNETNGQIPYWTTTSGTPARLGSVATGTLSVPTGLTVTGNRYVIGGNAVIGLDTGYVIPLQSTLDAKALGATTITVNGTANQITSSAGAQDLSANRTWTLSFPNLVIFPANASSTLFSTSYASTTELRGAGLTSCSNATTDKLLYNSTTGQFSCGTDQTSGGGSGITTLNGLTASTQSFATTSTTGGWGFSSSGSTHTLNIPTQNGSEVLGLISSTDWNTFNNKQGALTFVYPLVNSANSISLAFGTTTANSWSQVQTLSNGFLSQASSTFMSSVRMPTLSNGGLAVFGGLVSSGATTTAGTGLTYSGNAFNVNTSQNISTLSNLTSNGFVTTSGGTGALSIDTTTYTPTTRTLTAGDGLVGGGDLSANRTFDIAVDSTLSVSANSLGLNLSNANTWNALQTLGSGFLSAASSTIVGNATTTGGHYIGRLYGAGLTACNSTTEKLLWTATGQFTCGTDGGGGSASTTLLADTNYFSGVNRFLNASSTYHSFDTASSTQWIGGGLQTCNSTTGKLNWDSTTSQFRCDTDQTGGGGGTPAGSSGQIQFNNAGAFGGASGLVWDSVGAEFGVGTSTPQFPLHVSSTTRPQIALGGTSTDPAWTMRSIGGNFYISSSSPTTFATTTGNRGLTLRSTGSVGINNTAPAYALDIGGIGDNVATARVKSDTSTTNFILEAINGGDASFAFWENSNIFWTLGHRGSSNDNFVLHKGASGFNSPLVWTIVNTNNAMYNLGSGVFGTTTTTTVNPARFGLTVATSTTPQLALLGEVGQNQWTFRNAGGNLYLATSTVSGAFSTSTQHALLLDSNGQVFMPSLAVNVTGNAVCFTTGKQITDAGASSCVPSSQRYKENIKTLSIDSAKNILKKLRFTSFDYKKGFFSPEDSKTSYSPIAEEVEKIDKNLVDYSPDGKPQTLRWEAIMANIGVVTQDNTNEIEKLKKENEELKKRLEKLEAKIK